MPSKPPKLAPFPKGVGIANGGHMSEPTYPALPKPGRFIPGIYNYCDSWCGRCRFSSQCRVFQMRSTFERTTGTDDQREAAVTRMLADHDAAEEARIPELTPEDEARINDIVERQRVWVEAHALTTPTRHYGDTALEIVDELESMLDAKPDAVVALAFETIRHFAYMIPAKIHRALSGLADAQHEDADGNDDDGRMYDANGSARITRIGIAESRDAWRVLSEGRFGDGIPLDMIRQLSTIDAWLAQACPGAETFRRPGFDDEPDAP